MQAALHSSDPIKWHSLTHYVLYYVVLHVMCCVVGLIPFTVFVRIHHTCIIPASPVA